MIGYAALALMVISICAFFFSRSRAVASVEGQLGKLHSRPGYHGFYSLLWTAIIGFGILIVANMLAVQYVDYNLRNSLPPEALKLPEIKQNFLLDQAKAIAEGRLVTPADNEQEKVIREDLAKQFADMSYWRNIAISVAAIVLALIAFLTTYLRASPLARARNKTEGIVYIILALCAGVAILTTIGILGSLIGETVKFFSHVPVHKFLVWYAVVSFIWRF